MVERLWSYTKNRTWNFVTDIHLSSKWERHQNGFYIKTKLVFAFGFELYKRHSSFLALENEISAKKNEVNEKNISKKKREWHDGDDKSGTNVHWNARKKRKEKKNKKPNKWISIHVRMVFFLHTITWYEWAKCKIHEYIKFHDHNSHRGSLLFSGSGKCFFFSTEFRPPIFPRLHAHAPFKIASLSTNRLLYTKYFFFFFGNYFIRIYFKIESKP